MGGQLSPPQRLLQWRNGKKTGKRRENIESIGEDIGKSAALGGGGYGKGEKASLHSSSLLSAPGTLDVLSPGSTRLISLSPGFARLFLLLFF